MNAFWSEYSSILTRKRHTMTMQWRKTLFLFNSFSHSAISDLHLTCQTPLDVSCTFDNLQHKFPAASTLPSHHQHSWLRSLAECSGAAGRCDAFIISAIIFLQHLLQNIYLDIFLGSFAIYVVTSYVRMMLSNAHVAQFDLEEQMRHCLFVRTGHWVCVLALAAHRMESGEFTQSCGCAA